MSSVRRLIQFILNLLSCLRKIFQRIPVSIPCQRDVKKFLTPKKESEEIKVSSSSINIVPKAENKKTPIDKFKHVRSKVNTHWSPEEKKRSGLCTYFARKVSSNENSSATSPEMQRQAIKITKRKSFHSVSVSVSMDPLDTAIGQMKKLTTATSPTTSSSNSSFVSLPEWPVSHD